MVRNQHTFRKMNGLGNDFVVFDVRASGFKLDRETSLRVADRKDGVGCDQIILIEPSCKADVFMRVLNADGSEVNACGNATRCVAAIIANEKLSAQVSIETGAGLLLCDIHNDNSVSVDMGAPRLNWNHIPLARPFPDTATLDISFDAGLIQKLSDPGVVNVGNPHCVFFVQDIDAFDLAKIGPRLEHDPLFPERVNISLAQVISPVQLRLRVWERGVGLTEACGTAACAAAVAAVRKGLTERAMTVTLPGGDLRIEWRSSDDHIIMTGSWTLDYEGVFDIAAPALTH